MPKNKRAKPKGDRLGRDADRAADIPFEGWKRVIVRVYTNVLYDRVLLIAAGVTFYILLALIPAITAMISFYALFKDPASLRESMGAWAIFVPVGGMQIVQDQFDRVATQGGTTLGVTLLLSMGFAIWSATAGMSALLDAMNVAYTEKEKRSYVRVMVIAFLFVIGFTVGLLTILALVLLVPNLIGLLDLPLPYDIAGQVVGYLFLAIIVSIAIAVLYRWGPSRSDARWEWITPGMLLALVSLGVVSFGFSYYVSNFAAYNRYYGSLGTLIAFMTWTWLAVVILMIGAELNGELEHQTARDTTVPPRKPLGKRGAVMADQVAGLADASGDAKREDALRKTDRPARKDKAER